MRIILIFAIIFGAIPFIIIQPYLGTLMWVWISYMAPHKWTWGATYYYPFAQAIAITMIGAWLLSREPKRLPLTGITGFLLLFAAWVSITTLFALWPEQAQRQWDEVIKTIIMSLVTFLLIQSKRRIFWLIVVIVSTIGFFGFKGGIFVFLTDGEFIVHGAPGGSLSANNAIALAMVMAIPLMRYVQLEAKLPVVTWFTWIAIALCVLSILASYSRGAFLALIVMVGFMVIRERNTLLIAPVVIVGLLLGFSVMPDKWTSRIESIQEYESDLSAMSRLRMWGYGWSVATKRPVLGGGFGIYPATEHYARFGFALCEPGVSNEVTANCTMKGRSAHNILMEVLGEHGFIGLTIFVLMGVYAFRVNSWMRQVAAGRPDLMWVENLGRMVQASIIGYLAGGMFVDKAYLALYYHLLVITAAAATVVKHELSQKPVPAGAAARAVTASS